MRAPVTVKELPEKDDEQANRPAPKMSVLWEVKMEAFRGYSEG